MLGKRTRQLSIADVDGWRDRIARHSVWFRMHEWSDVHLSDEAFAGWYAQNGRPSIPPSYMVTLLLLQVRQGWSDREAVEAAMFDDRVKFALGTSRMPEIHCDHTTVVRYRARLLESNLGRQLVGETLKQAADAGLLSNDEDLVDSFPIAGFAARQSTHVLIYRAIGRVLSEASEAGLAVGPLKRSDYGQHRKPAIRWSDDSERQRLLEDLVADGRTLVALFGQTQIEALGQAVKLLGLVVEQDIETVDGQVRIAQKTAKDRIVSTEDPEMRHGRKTSSQRFNGFKGHVMTTNGGRDEAHLVTAVVVTAANAGDGEMLPALLAQRAALTGEMPAQVMGDTAYGSMEVRNRVAEAAPAVRVEAPVPPASAAGGRYAKTDFAIDTQACTVRCPAGQTVTYRPKKAIDGHKRVQTIAFPAALCGACPLRAQCVGGKRGRTLSIGVDEARVATERARQEAPQWQDHYRKRSRVEHVNARLTRHGARHARGHGVARVQLQVCLAATVANIEEMARALGRVWQAPGPFRPQCEQTAV